jgi:hypothetical protein
MWPMEVSAIEGPLVKFEHAGRLASTADSEGTGQPII